MVGWTEVSTNFRLRCASCGERSEYCGNRVEDDLLAIARAFRVGLEMERLSMDRGQPVLEMRADTDVSMAVAFLGDHRQHGGAIEVWDESGRQYPALEFGPRSVAPPPD